MPNPVGDYYLLRYVAAFNSLFEMPVEEPGEWKMEAFAFNSLFEMLYLLERLGRVSAGSFNSLFEMLIDKTRVVTEFLKRLFQFSI